MLLIGIGHKARQGKDTVAKEMVMEFGKQGLYAKTYGFADALKDVCRVQYGMTTKDAPLLQLVGTELFRRKDPDVWVNALKHRIMEEAPEVAIIVDVRFPNEAAMVKTLGRKLVKVSRYLEYDVPFVAPDRPADHPSEIALDGFKDWDCYITAKDGDMDYLLDQAEDLAREWSE